MGKKQITPKIKESNPIQLSVSSNLKTLTNTWHKTSGKKTKKEVQGKYT
jgi:hypothetical protein